MNRTSARNSRIVSSRHIVLSALILVAAAIFITALFHSLYSSVKNNLLNIWENKTVQMARSTAYYLSRPADAIEFTAIQLENMMDHGQSNREIGELLIREMETYAPLVDNNYTGVYGYCRGEYLDASGWIPDEGYDPTARPWYRAAKQAGGKVAFVPPYMNLQTHVMMVSVSKLLKDGQSVVSMDIFLDGIQQMTEDMLTEESVSAAFIMDKRGAVVAHSDPSRVGKNYTAGETDAEKALAMRVLAGKDDRISAKTAKSGEIVFSEPINDDWYAVLILNRSALLKSIRFIKLSLWLILILTVSGWYAISYSIHRKYREAEQLTREVNAVADIYEAMTLIDLKTNRMTPLRMNPVVEKLLEGDLSDYSGRILRMAEQMSSDHSRDLLVQFMDPATYNERMQAVNSISHDFMDADGRWVRIQLIVVDRENDGRLRHMIWALE